MPVKPTDRSFEQGLCVLLMLALQDGHVPVGSSALAGWLEVSDSYLKKILRKLTVAGLVRSRACPRGGFTLARSPEDITVADVQRALHPLRAFEPSGLGARVFPDAEHAASVGEELRGLFSRARAAYEAQLETVSLADLLLPDAWPKGSVDWRELARRDNG